MQSALCEMTGVEFPLVAFSHCRDVVAAVSKAGAFGVFGCSNGSMTPEQFKTELDWIDANTGGMPYGLDIAVPENMENRNQQHQTSRTLMAEIPERHKQFVEDLLTKHGVNTRTSVPADDEHDISHFLDTAEKLVDEGLRHPIRLFVNALGRPPAVPD